MVLTVMC